MRRNAEIEFMKLLRNRRHQSGDCVSFLKDAANDPSLNHEVRRYAKAFSAMEESDGGSGSGNFGHSGRPGQIGGSGGGGSGKIETAEQFHKAVHLVEKEIDKKPAGSSIECPYPGDPFKRKSVFTKERDGTWTQSTFAGKIPLGRASGWTSYMVGTEIVNYSKNGPNTFEEDGGPGSGNWGHKGRPGYVGGSGKGGGSQYRGGRGDIGYFSSKRDWLNGLKGEKQHQASQFLKECGELYGEEGKTVEQSIMESGPRRRKKEMLSYMAEARGWDRNAQKLADENLDEQEKNLAAFLAKKYGVDPKNDMPDDADMSGWDNEDKDYWFDLKSKAMGGPTSGKEPPDELMYEAGLKERPKPQINTAWANELSPTDRDDAARYLSYASKTKIESFDDPDAIEAAERLAFEHGYDDYQSQRNLKLYLMRKLPGSGISEIGTEFNQDLYDRLDTLEYGQLIRLVKESKRNGDQNVFDTLDYKNNQERMEGYALLNKAMGGADVTESILQKNREAFQKEEEERNRLIEEQKRKAEEARKKAEEAKRQREEAEAKRAPIVQAAKESLRDDGLVRSINEAQTTDDVAKAISGPGMFQGDRAAQFSGMDIAVAKDTAVAYSNVMQEYPFLVGELGAPGMNEQRKNTYASSRMYSDGAVNFNPKRYASKTELAKSYESDVRSGFHPAGTDYTSIAVHELGHSMDGWLTKKLKSVGFGKTSTVSYDLCKSIKKAMGIKGTIDDFRSLTSKYCTDGNCKKGNEYKEWFAETFAEAFCSKNPRPVAVEFRKQLTKLISDNGFEESLNK